MINELISMDLFNSLSGINLLVQEVSNIPLEIDNNNLPNQQSSPEKSENADAFKTGLLSALSSIIVLTALFYFIVSPSKKTSEEINILDYYLARAYGEEKLNKMYTTEQYRKREFILPVLLAWVISVIGLYSVFFGPDLVSRNPGKINFLLTGLFSVEDKYVMQEMRVQGMVVMSVAFLSAFILSFQYIIRRISTYDLSPAVYFDTTSRLIFAPVISLIIGHLFVSNGADPGHPVLIVVAFLVGFFPNEAFQYLKESSPIRFLRSTKKSHVLSLTMIEGIGVHDRSKLAELGIDDAQDLATANFMKLLLRTHYSATQIMDWVGQARLYIYFKDEITKLRKNSIRSSFDLVEIKDPERLKAICERTDIDPESMRLFIDSSLNDPTLVQLNKLRQVIIDDAESE